MPLPRPERSPGGLPSWQDLLESATTTSQIVALANEYLGRLEPSEMVLLPSRCKIRSLQTPADINGYAFDLKTCQCEDWREAQLVDRLTAFFQEVCQRLAVITGPQKAVGADLWSAWGTVSRVDE